ncbi:hypothetical protein L810_7684 [Burkholderia sp. AU4i]|nr:hypothetical protein L810_7684 [Burkholderia sp. AU4i]
MVVKKPVGRTAPFQFKETQMIDRLFFSVIHNDRSRVFDDSAPGALRYKRLAWCL